MALFKIIGFIIFVFAVSLTAGPAAKAANSDQDVACQSQIRQQLKAAKGYLADWSKRLTGAKISGAFSQRLGGCLALVEGRSQNVWFIFDFENKIMTENDPLFYCDVDGVDNIDIEIARKYRSRLATTSYFKYMNDGAGGPPRVVSTAVKPFTPKQCEAIFSRQIRALTS